MNMGQFFLTQPPLGAYGQNNAPFFPGAMGGFPQAMPFPGSTSGQQQGYLSGPFGGQQTTTSPHPEPKAKDKKTTAPFDLFQVPIVEPAPPSATEPTVYQVPRGSLAGSVSVPQLPPHDEEYLRGGLAGSSSLSQLSESENVEGVAGHASTTQTPQRGSDRNGITPFTPGSFPSGLPSEPKTEPRNYNPRSLIGPSEQQIHGHGHFPQGSQASFGPGAFFNPQNFQSPGQPGQREQSTPEESTGKPEVGTPKSERITNKRRSANFHRHATSLHSIPEHRSLVPFGAIVSVAPPKVKASRSDLLNSLTNTASGLPTFETALSEDYFPFVESGKQCVPVNHGCVKLRNVSLNFELLLKSYHPIY